jgi:hypothetical protein
MHCLTPRRLSRHFVLTPSWLSTLKSHKVLTVTHYAPSLTQHWLSQRVVSLPVDLKNTEKAKDLMLTPYKHHRTPYWLSCASSHSMFTQSAYCLTLLWLGPCTVSHHAWLSNCIVSLQLPRMDSVQATTHTVLFQRLEEETKMAWKLRNKTISGPVYI